MATLDELQQDIGTWQQQVFGGNKDRVRPILLHLKKEVDELEMALFKSSYEMSQDVSSEAADIIILLSGMAHRLGFSLQEAIANKMAINRGRQWQPPNDHGIIEHKRTPEDGSWKTHSLE